jgi:uncharacterized membrane protein
MRNGWRGRVSTTVPTTIGSIGVDGIVTDPRPGPRRGRAHRRAGLVAIGLLAAAGLLPAGVVAQQEITLTTPFPAVSVAPGSDVSFGILVGVAEAGRVDLEVDGVPADWTATMLGGGFVVDGVLGDPEEAVPVTLNVDVPVDATDGTSTVTVTGSGGDATASLELDIRVTATAAGDLTLTTENADLRGSADVSFTFTLNLNNDTPEALTFAAIAAGPDGWNVNATLAGQAQAASAVIEAGATQTIEVTADPGGRADAGTYPIGVRVTAGDYAVEQALSVEITGSFGLELSTPDDRLSASTSAGGSTSVSLDVANTGTAPLESVALGSSTPTGWTVTFDPEAVTALPPGQAVSTPTCGRRATARSPTGRCARCAR